MHTHSRTSKFVAGLMTTAVIFGTAQFTFAEDEINASVSVDAQASLNAPTSAKGATKSRSNIQNNREGKPEDHGNGEMHTLALASSTATSTNKGKRVETKIQIKAKLDAKKQENVAKVISNRVHSFEKVIAAQSKRIDRVAEVAAKIGTSTASTTVSLKFIADARAELAQASSTLLSIKATTTTSATNPGAALTALKTKFDSVHDDIMAAHKLTQQAIVSLKSNKKVESHGTTTNPTATTTASTTVSN